MQSAADAIAVVCATEHDPQFERDRVRDARATSDHSLRAPP